MSASALNAITYQRDAQGRITSESDNVSSVTYVYSDAGQITSTTQSSVGGPTVTLTYQYDSAGHRTQMAATIDGTADFVDDYTYDSLGRVVSVSEHGVTGGNAVAEKRIDLVYNDAGQLLSIDRYENSQLAVEGDYSYDGYGRLIGLVYHQGETVLNSYTWTYSGTSSTPLAPREGQADSGPSPLSSLLSSLWAPTGGLMPIHDTTGVTDALSSGGLSGFNLLTSCTSGDGTAYYTYDPTGQLIGAHYSPLPSDGRGAGGEGVLPEETYSYDPNGNRTSVVAGLPTEPQTATYTTGPGNQLLSDGTYYYAYDAEGNRIARFVDLDADGVLDAGDTDISQHAWDARNRLAEVIHYATYANLESQLPDQVVDYLYDVENRWIGQTIDSDGDGQIDHQTRFAYDGNQIVLQFDGDCPDFAQQNGTVPCPLEGWALGEHCWTSQQCYSLDFPILGPPLAALCSFPALAAKFGLYERDPTPTAEDSK